MLLQNHRAKEMDLLQFTTLRYSAVLKSSVQRINQILKGPEQKNAAPKDGVFSSSGAVDGTRTRDPRRDRPVL